METRANYALIGLFTLLVVGAAFLFVYWFASSESGRERAQLRIVFEGSVAGLNRGAPVNFNGIRVGEVTQLAIAPENPSLVVARVSVDPATPLRQDTTARLEFQGLTGIASVSLSGGSPDAEPLIREDQPGLPTIRAEPSDFQDLIESARNIARRASDVFDRFDALVSENDQAVAATVQNVERFSRALADNAPAIDNFLEQVGAAAERIGPLADSLDELSRNVNSVVAAVDSESVARSVQNVEAFTRTLADSEDDLRRTFEEAATLVARLSETAVSVEATVSDVRAFVAALDAEAIDATVGNVRDFSQTLADRREDFGRVVENASVLTENLAASSQRLDATLANVEGVSQTIADNRENIATIISGAAELSTRLNDTSLSLQAALTDVERIVAAVDPARIETTVGNVEAFSETLAANREAVDRVVANAATLTENLAETSRALDGTIARVDALVAAVDPTDVSVTVENARAFSQTLADNRDAVGTALREIGRIAQAIDAQRIETVIANAERFAQALGDASPDVDVIVANARSITEQLDASAGRVDRVLAAAEDFLGTAAGEEGEALFDEVREAAAAIRLLAENLDTRTEALSTNFNRFTGSGMQEVRALAEEGRRTLQDIGRAVRSFERDPSQVIFGGDGGGGVREYQGRR